MNYLKKWLFPQKIRSPWWSCRALVTGEPLTHVLETQYRQQWHQDWRITTDVSSGNTTPNRSSRSFFSTYTRRLWGVWCWCSLPSIAVRTEDNGRIRRYVDDAVFGLDTHAAQLDVLRVRWAHLCVFLRNKVWRMTKRKQQGWTIQFTCHVYWIKVYTQTFVFQKAIADALVIHLYLLWTCPS